MASAISTLSFMRLFLRQRNADLDARIAKHKKIMATSPPIGLNLLAVGDSWFDYPIDGDLIGPHTDVLAALGKVGNPKPEILSLAHYGYTSTQEMGLARQSRLVSTLTDPANGKFDAILMSAGGNDIAGDALVVWLNDAKSVNYNWNYALDLTRLYGALEVIKSSYLDMIAIRDEFAPGTPIFAHSYDLPIVDGKGVCTLGPWLKPAFDFCGWTDQAKCNGIMAVALQSFANMLSKLAASSTSGNFKHVQTQGTISAADWVNELHPSPHGFELIAAKFQSELAKTFPGRV